MSVWVVGSSVLSPLGGTTSENYAAVRSGRSGVRPMTDASLSDHPIAVAQLSDFHASATLSRFEKLCYHVLNDALHEVSLDPKRTIFILSTTKGNIALLNDREKSESLPLHATAQKLASLFGFGHSLVVSNACISGVLAVIVAKRFLEGGLYDHAVVVGADELSRFVVSGFESLHALSRTNCRPFDASRDGINLGEGAAAWILSAKPEKNTLAKISGGGVSNDANHISGPSRTGNELAMAIHQALSEAGINAADIDFISAHGTATLFNDEMESKAFAQAGLLSTPVHSLKGYFGHTLGAAGLVESSICMEALRFGEIPGSLGFSELGVSEPLTISGVAIEKKSRTCLKTASGFGGCNAAIVIEKI